MNQICPFCLNGKKISINDRCWKCCECGIKGFKSDNYSQPSSPKANRVDYVTPSDIFSKFKLIKRYEHYEHKNLTAKPVNTEDVSNEGTTAGKTYNKNYWGTSMNDIINNIETPTMYKYITGSTNTISSKL